MATRLLQGTTFCSASRRRHDSSWSCRSIFTGQTLVQLPHRVLAKGSSRASCSPAIAGPSTDPMGPGTVRP